MSSTILRAMTQDAARGFMLSIPPNREPSDPLPSHDPNRFCHAWQAFDRDLDYAIKHLQYKVDPGIIGLGLARQLRAESAMWQEDYTTAAAQADAIITGGHHKLVGISEILR